MPFKTSDTFRPFTVESWMAEWNGRLIVGCVPNRKFEHNTLFIHDYFTKEVIAKIPVDDMRLGSALVVSGVLHIWGTDPTGTYIYHKSTTDPDLLIWSARDIAWHTTAPGQTFYNVSVCKAGANFAMDYEVNEPGFPGSFRVRCFTSTDLLNWNPHGGLWGDGYTACPKLHYRSSNGMWYRACLKYDGTVFRTKMFRAPALEGPWTESAYPAGTPTMPCELTNVSDFEWCPFDGSLYGMYAAGDQGNGASNAMDLRQWWHDGTLDSFLDQFFP